MNRKQKTEIVATLLRVGRRDLARKFVRAGNGPVVTAAKKHKDVEYQVGNKYFKTFDEACGQAVSQAMSGGSADLDVLVSSEAGAKALMGDAGVEQYREDPEASVFTRLEIKVNDAGRIP